MAGDTKNNALPSLGWLRLRPRAMIPDLHSFADIHCHTSVGPDRVTSISPECEITTEQGSAWYSVGIHPWDTDSPVGDELFSRLEELAYDDRVVAIGECGLDALRGGDEKVQEDVFIRQIDIAQRVGKPLIIHCVRRVGELLKFRKLYPKGLWIYHGFRGKPETARQLAAAGIAISIGPATSREKYASIPDELIFTETDK